jgi:hypothetical protein
MYKNFRFFFVASDFEWRKLCVHADKVLIEVFDPKRNQVQQQYQMHMYINQEIFTIYSSHTVMFI